MKINFSNHYNSLVLLTIAIIFWLTPLTNYNCYSADDPVGPPAPASVPAAQNQNDWNNILKQNTTEFLDWAKLTASKTTNFVSEQTPLYIQEYLAWIFWENLLSVVIYFGIFFTFVFLTVKFFKQIKGWSDDGTEENDWKDKSGENNVFFIASLVISCICFTFILFGGGKYN